ncbi:MAG: acyl transferase [Flavobacteriaceae bacterium]|nr:acyl transferase [Flavobacteriaceae bacterium]
MFSIFNIKSKSDFKQKTFEVFKHQFENNAVYRSFCDLLNIHVTDVSEISQIPFLPIEFFKTHKVISSQNSIQEVFTSSGTTKNKTSKHYVTDISVYTKSYHDGFKKFYGNIEDYVILALLPNYIEQKESSLIYMVDDLMKCTKNSESGFFLKNHQKLAKKLQLLDKKGQKVLLIGVSFALLDLIENHQFELVNTIVMETGGMKGRRKELIRTELHDLLKKGFGTNQIHSEYGMTELLSQAYSKHDGIFNCPPWMQVLTRDTEDPLTVLSNQKIGGINIIDLANYNSCSFIATQDLGKVYDDHSFEILGRFDHSDIRGCNLMIN